MKHTFQITLGLILIFIASQVMGLFIINQYYSYDDADEIYYQELPLNLERPDVKEEVSWLFIFSAIIIGTLILLLFVKLGVKYLTKIWFFFAIFLGLTFAFNAFVDERIAIVLAIIFAGAKIFYPNPYVHNFSEIFIYGGIAVLFHEMLSVRVTVLLIILIAIYDMIAVWKIKHMVTLAKYQTEQNLFAGAMIPYKKIIKAGKGAMKAKKIKNKKPQKMAILGGGDMAFPLLLAAAVMKEYSLVYALILVLTSTIALSILFFKASKDKFYPAMPFLAAGSILGLIIIYLI
jgi:presenilin-like A22 family membrane protease